MRYLPLAFVLLLLGVAAPSVRAQDGAAPAQPAAPTQTPAEQSPRPLLPLPGLGNPGAPAGPQQQTQDAGSGESGQQSGNTKQPDLTTGTLVERLQQIWSYPLFNSGGNTVQLNQIVIALLLLLVGIFVARTLTRLLRSRLVRMKRVNIHAAAVIQKIVFYLLVTVIVLVALPMAGIPITVFTVLGGALAIGVGFGAQSLIDNLISGFILISERPIRIGDIVEVDGHEGRVEEIGNRATRVRRTDGVDLLVPNSHFLSSIVFNWTLHDNTLRGSVSVGVAYGSPTRQVEKLISRALKEHPSIITSQAMEILFTEFGDNSLNFKAFFWTHVTRPMDLRRVESDVRYRIDELFRDADITISFPQRDIHLDTLKPLEVRVVDRASE